jgi:tetratricopeptide (TPR) repeat protein
MNGRFVEALRYARRAVEIKPAEVWPYDDIAQVYALIGDFDSAESWFRRSAIVAGSSPSKLQCELADLAWHRGDSARVRVHLDSIRAMPDPGDFALDCAVHLELALGNVNAARALLERGARSRFTPDGVPRLPLARVAQHAGDTARAGALIREAEALNLQHWRLCDGRCANYALARTHAMQGKVDEAIEFVRRSIETGFTLWYPSAPDPFLARIETDPRFQELMSELRTRLDREREQEEKAEDARDEQRRSGRVGITSRFLPFDEGIFERVVPHHPGAGTDLVTRHRLEAHVVGERRRQGLAAVFSEADPRIEPTGRPARGRHEYRERHDAAGREAGVVARQHEAEIILGLDEQADARVADEHSQHEWRCCRGYARDKNSVKSCRTLVPERSTC